MGGTPNLQCFEKKNEWQIELDEARMQFDFISQENDEIIQKASALLTLCKNAHSAYLAGDVLQKRALLKLITSHFLWNGLNLTITIKNTFKPMFEGILSNMVGVELQCSNFIIPIKNYLDELEKPENILLFKQLETFTENLKIA